MLAPHPLAGLGAVFIVIVIVIVIGILIITGALQRIETLVLDAMPWVLP